MTIDIIHLWVIIISILKADMYMIHHLSWYIDILCSILNYDHDSTLTLSSNLQSLYSYFHISSLFSYLYDLFNETLHIDLDAYQVQLATNKDLSSYHSFYGDCYHSSQSVILPFDKENSIEIVGIDTNQCSFYHYLFITLSKSIQILSTLYSFFSLLWWLNRNHAILLYPVSINIPLSFIALPSSLTTISYCFQHSLVCFFALLLFVSI